MEKNYKVGDVIVDYEEGAYQNPLNVALSTTVMSRGKKIYKVITPEGLYKMENQDSAIIVSELVRLREALKANKNKTIRGKQNDR